MIKKSINFHNCTGMLDKEGKVVHTSLKGRINIKLLKSRISITAKPLGLHGEEGTTEMSFCLSSPEQGFVVDSTSEGRVRTVSGFIRHKHSLTFQFGLMIYEINFYCEIEDENVKATTKIANDFYNEFLNCVDIAKEYRQ